MRRSAVTWALTFGLCIALPLGLLGCGDDAEPRLEALQKDPLAKAQLAEATNVRVTETEGSTGSKPSPAKIRRTFAVPAGSAETAIESLAEEARAAGWSIEPRDAIGFDGTKTVEGLSAQVIIAGVPTENRVWVEILTRDN